MAQCNIAIPKRHNSHLQCRHYVCNVCGINDPCLPIPVEQKIFQLEELIGKSCFEITHHLLCQGLWIAKGGISEKMLRQGR